MIELQMLIKRIVWAKDASQFFKRKAIIHYVELPIFFKGTHIMIRLIIRPVLNKYNFCFISRINAVESLLGKVCCIKA